MPPIVDTIFSSFSRRACPPLPPARGMGGPPMILQRSAKNMGEPPMPRAFTLTELLIVIGIIVLFVTMALPAFNLIGGSKSIAGAENEISALLGRARNEAIGVQDYRGLAIYRDAATDRYCAAIVESIVNNAPAWPTATPAPAYPQYSYVTYGGNQYVALQYVPPNGSAGASPPSTTPTYWTLCTPYPGSMTMDITPDSDIQTFPIGVGVQVINNCTMNAGVRASNGYLPIGVILFNSEGLLTATQSVSFSVYGHLGRAGNFNAYNLVTSPVQAAIPFYYATTGKGLPLSSSFGLVVYDKQSFENNNFYSSLTPQFPTQLVSQSTPTAGNTAYTPGTSGSGDGQADAWLDTNSTPLLINRYNGTLIRSE